MGKILVFAEKPSLAKLYKSALGNNFEDKKVDNVVEYYENNKYVITWTYGHILKMKGLSEYDENFKNGEYVINNVPYFPEKHLFKLNLQDDKKVKNSSKKGEYGNNNAGILRKAKTFKLLFQRKDIDFIVNGCDAGREGEAIFYYAYHYFKCSFPAKRLWVSSQETKEVRKQFNNLLPEKLNLKSAAYARAEADWEYAINLSALYSRLYGTHLTLGRVQTPVLNLIIQRENEIKNFKPEDYFLIDGHFKTLDGYNYKGRLITKDTIKTLAEVSKIKNDVENSKGFIKDVSKKKISNNPPLLFNLNELQKTISRKYKLTAKETLLIAQDLYEKYKITTYPRTDSKYLTEDMDEKVYTLLNSLPKQFNKVVNLAKSTGYFFKDILNNKGVSDHYAIVPTENAKNIDLATLPRIHQLVFVEIAKRFLSLFLKPYVYESTAVITSVNEHDFKTTGNRVIDMGFKILYKNEAKEKKEDEEDFNIEYNFTKNQEVLVDTIEDISKQTKPPKRYNVSTILEAMEKAGKHIETDDADIKKALIESKGIGTSATRADIIENLIRREYINYDKKTTYYSPTEKGIDFIKLIKVEEMKSAELTGEWEVKLKKIEMGIYSSKQFKDELRNFVKYCVKKVKDNVNEKDKVEFQQFSSTGPSTKKDLGCKCLLCGGNMISDHNFYRCDNYPDCRFFIKNVLLGKKISERDIISLCKNGYTPLIKGFSKDGQKFDACIIFNKELKKIQFKRNNHSPSEFHCPLCGKFLVEHEVFYGCSGYKDGCKFSISKQIYGKKISKSDIKSLLEKGTSGPIKGFKNKDRNGNSYTYEGQLYIDGEVVRVRKIKK